MSAPRNARGTIIPPSLQLALRQIRQTWHLNLLTAIGLFITVTLICAIPIFAQIAQTAALWGAVSNNPNNLNVDGSMVIDQLNTTLYGQYDSKLNSTLQQHIGPYLNPAREVSLRAVGITLPGDRHPLLSFTFYGLEQPRLAQLALAHGAVPPMTAPLSINIAATPINAATPLGIAITQDAANDLHLQVGSPLPVTITDSTGTSLPKTLLLTITGIIDPLPTPSTFWQGNDLHTQPIEDNNGSIGEIDYRAVLPLSSLLALSAAVTQSAADSSYFGLGLTMQWWYTVDVHRMHATDLPAIANQFTMVKDNINDEAAPTGHSINLSGGLFDPSDPLTTINNQFISLQIPLAFLIVLFIGLAIYFVALMADLLLEQQSDTIAVLRSRGFSRWQIYLALAWQYLGLTLAAMLLGVVLAIPSARLIGTIFLTSQDQVALTVLNQSLALLSMIIPYAVFVGGVALLAMVLAVRRAMQLDLLSLRRESSRATRRPLWQRLHLDIVAIIIGAVVFGLATYLQAALVGISPQTDRLLAPVFVLAPIAFVMVIILLLLRVFGLLLRGAARLAQRTRNAPAMLALAQIARAPMQALRMGLMLTLAVTSTLFIFGFSASHTARADDEATYLVGADFVATTHNPPDQVTVIPGVQAASAGYVTQLQHISNIVNGRYTYMTYTVLAVDIPSYIRTARWPQQSGTLDASLLMRLHTGPCDGPAPALVDERTWNELNLSTGKTFLLRPNFDQANIAFKAIGKVPILPNVPVQMGGVLADYSCLVPQLGAGTSPPNRLWIRTTNNTATLTAVRQFLQTNGDNIGDRRALLIILQSDPLNRILGSLLAIGLFLPLALLLVGDLTASWLVIQQRLRAFAALRALGANARHILGIMLWEQGLTHIIALGMGLIAGWLLSVSAIPHLIFTTVPKTQDVANSDVFQLQSIPAIRVLFPLTAWVTVGMVVVTGAIVIYLLVVRVLRASLSQALRIDED